ncbi:hypothetical protein LEMLEM_LOCUS18826, partial [Lemmus lemmus]
MSQDPAHCPTAPSSRGAGATAGNLRARLHSTKGNMHRKRTWPEQSPRPHY